MIVDSHQHLWQIGRNGHEWPTPDLTTIYRDFDIGDLHAVTDPSQVTATVLVQSQPSDADTEWMLDVAGQSRLVQGVVGWADLAAPDAVNCVTRLSRRAKLMGLRPMLQGLGDDWILQPAVQPALAAMSDRGLSFDALVFTRHLRAIDTMARAFPRLPIVIDHCAKPPIMAADEALTAAWRDELARVAQNANVFCKLSGLVTEMAEGQRIDDALPYADHAFDSFGPERLMWGSDWPVVTLRSPYDAWLDWTKSWLAGKTPAACDAILGGTARSFYKLI